ncbi:hypothetical protein [Spongiactinospora sp. 9N601]|uniref:hypothetical protein n=1 Tax=Spongiactinospora sp. 9N601 TaxID=3375149 RepID=UPI003798FB6D
MVRLAEALYAQGLSPAEVLRQCYGVDFPTEFFLIVREGLRYSRPLAAFTKLPWSLGVPPGEEPPYSLALLTEGAVRRIFVRDPDLVPLVRLTDLVNTPERPMICYRLTELQAGSTAVFRVKVTAASHDEIVRCGESLLAVLRATYAERLRHMEWVVDQPSNRGFGAMDQQMVDDARALLERVEGLRRGVEERR